MIPLCLRTARSNGHSDTFSSNFFPNPSGSLIPRVKNNNNNNCKGAEILLPKLCIKQYYSNKSQQLPRTCTIDDTWRKPEEVSDPWKQASATKCSIRYNPCKQFIRTHVLSFSFCHLSFLSKHVQKLGLKHLSTSYLVDFVWNRIGLIDN